MSQNISPNLALSSISDLPDFSLTSYNPNFDLDQNLAQFDQFYIEITREYGNEKHSYKMSLYDILKFIADLYGDKDASPYIRINNETRPIILPSNTSSTHGIGVNEDDEHGLSVHITDFLLAQDVRNSTNFLRVDKSISPNNKLPYVQIDNETRKMLPASTFNIDTKTNPLKIINRYDGKSNVISACATSAIWN